MDNKFLITIIVPTVEMEFNVYIPNNKKIGTIKKYIFDSIVELSNNAFHNELTNTRFINRETGQNLQNDMYVKDSGIKNGARVIVM